MSTSNSIKSSANNHKHSIKDIEQTQKERILNRIDIEETLTFVNSFDFIHVDLEKTINQRQSHSNINSIASIYYR